MGMPGLISLDSVPFVGSNIDWPDRNYVYLIEILTKEQGLGENREVEAIPAFAPGLSPFCFVLGVLFSDNPRADRISKD